MYNDERKESQFNRYLPLLYRHPDARAMIAGSDAYPMLKGVMNFYQTENGILVGADIMGLPAQPPQKRGVFGLHIHEGTSCTGNDEDPFAGAMLHYNPTQMPHPFHAGDLPPLFSTNRGTAFFIFLTDAFRLNDIIGRTVIIHSAPDDFTTQPSGNSGQKIACGVIAR